MLHCTPFLLFQGNCAEAMNFYKECFGGDLQLMRTGDTPMKDQFPPEKHDLIINAHPKSAGLEISATDWHADNLAPQPGNTIGIYLTGENFEEVKAAFDKLANGADKDTRTFMEPRDMPLGVYGQLTDKFGVSWVLVAQGKPQK